MRAVEAFNRLDTEALVEELDPEVEWYSPLPGMRSDLSRAVEGVFELGRESESCSRAGPWSSPTSATSEIEPAPIGRMYAVATGRGRDRGVVHQLAGLQGGKVLRVRCTTTPRRPSKPWGCRSRALQADLEGRDLERPVVYPERLGPGALVAVGDRLGVPVPEQGEHRLPAVVAELGQLGFDGRPRRRPGQRAPVGAAVCSCGVPVVAVVNERVDGGPVDADEPWAARPDLMGRQVAFSDPTPHRGCGAAQQHRDLGDRQQLIRIA